MDMPPGGFDLAKPDWGSKRQCHSCGARFYDLNRVEVVCPKCGTTYDPDAVLKSRRSRPAPAEEKVVPVPAEEARAEPEAEEAEPAEAASGAEGEEKEEEELIEDTSELGEDEDDVAEVLDNVDEEEER
jgi:uncharacterized protein (TIGR02300 family)